MFYRNNLSVEQIIRSVYSEELSEILVKFLKMSERIVYSQSSIQDYIGMRIDIDDKVINYNTFGKYFLFHLLLSLLLKIKKEESHSKIIVSIAIPHMPSGYWCITETVSHLVRSFLCR